MNNLVIIESPYAGDVESNLTYARKCIRDSLLRGEDPLASHLLYTQEGVLNDSVPEERARGISAGLHWYAVADKAIFYLDRGFSSGMIEALIAAKNYSVEIEFRLLEK
jgi:hypothetical protein